jgi:hypothetical protein
LRRSSLVLCFIYLLPCISETIFWWGTSLGRHFKTIARESQCRKSGYQDPFLVIFIRLFLVCPIARLQQPDSRDPWFEFEMWRQRNCLYGPVCETEGKWPLFFINTIPIPRPTPLISFTRLKFLFFQGERLSRLTSIADTYLQSMVSGRPLVVWYLYLLNSSIRTF